MQRTEPKNARSLRFDAPKSKLSSDWYHRWGKRTFDVLAACVLTLLLSPIMLMTFVVVAWRIGRPVLFWQQRAGQDGVAFQICKFRTMTDEVDEQGRPLPDERRLTKLGKLLRGASLDEFPQLWNVLRGEMSLVGPRPLLYRYNERYTPEQRRRLEVRPGLTGQAQVHGRNSLSWEEKFSYDVWYVDRQSLWLDISILLKTVFSLAKRTGISSTGHATAPEFMGSDAAPPTTTKNAA